MDKGGAGRAALRLHKSLLVMGQESKVLCLYKNTEEPEVIKFENHYSILNRILFKTGLKKTVKEKNKRLLRKYPKTYFIFNFPETDNKIHEHPLVKEADIIHLHYISGFVDFPSFFKNINRPVVWTIHDKNPVMGGFHLKIDKDKNRSNKINELEEKCFSIKQQALKNIKDAGLGVTAPSKFLAGFSSGSEMLGRFKHYHIYNAVDLGLFRPVDRTEARAEFDLPVDTPVLLFVSEGLEQYHKGADILTEALKGIDDKYVLVTIGMGRITGLDNVINLGPVHDDKKLRMLYSAADASLLPSREDNLPNIMLESMACGTPVIATPVGGMRDVIRDGFNGLLAGETDPGAYKEVLKKFLKEPDKFNREEIRQFAEQNFSFEKQAVEFMKIYESMAGNG
jgi:glycosyltransferase involved in cell wall biosynthesis